jgi:hypothetical protein
MKIRKLLFITLLIMLPAASYGQLGRLIKNTAAKAVNTINNAAEKEANRRADSIAQKNAERAVQETSKNINNDIKKNNEANKTQSQETQGQGGINLGMLMGGKVDLKYSEEYNFTSRLYMQTETYDKQEVMKLDLWLYFSSKTSNAGIETKSVSNDQGNSTPLTSSIVMDGENKCIIILTEMTGSKMGIISPLPDENSAQKQTDGQPAQKAAPANFTKTGNTKVIAGYKCDEYSYKDIENKSTGKVWFTKEANLKIDKRGWQQTGMAAYYDYAGFDGGIIMGNEAYDEKGKLTMKSETKEINQDFAHTISVKGYSMMQMNLNQSQPKK